MKEDNIYDLLEIRHASMHKVDKTKDSKAFTMQLTVLMVVYNIMYLYLFYIINSSSSGYGGGMVLVFIVLPILVISLILLAVFLVIKRKQFQLSRHWPLVLFSTPILLFFLFITFYVQ